MRRDNEPFELCRIFKILYETEFNDKYIICPRDLRAAKELYALNGDLQRSEIVEPAKRYLSDKFWTDRNHPAYGLFEHFMQYAIDRKPKPKGPKPPERTLVVVCSDCGSEHDAHQLCPKCYPELTGDRGTAFDAVNQMLSKHPSKRGRP